MTSLVIKDMFNLFGNMKQMLLVGAFMSLCLVSTTGINGILFMSTFLSCIMIITSFNIDEFSNWCAFALTMPVNRKQYVGAKFLTGMALSLGGCILGLIFTGILAVLMKIMENLATGSVVTIFLQRGFEGQNIGIFLVSILMYFCLALFISSSCIPFMIKFGSNRGRIIVIIVIAAILGMCSVIVATIDETVHLSQSPTTLSAAIVVALLLYIAIAYKLAYYWFCRKEL